MAFQFRLESVLRLQRSLEKQEENRLLALVAQVAAFRNEMNAWEEERRRRKRQAAEEMNSGSTAAALSLTEEWDLRVTRKQQELASKLLQAEEARRAQVAKVQQERQKREVLEGLKDRLRTVQNREELRRIQQVLDDMHLTRAFHFKG
jgi:flagellar export protein FliJ